METPTQTTPPVVLDRIVLAFAFRLPKGFLRRWKAKRCSHNWWEATATISTCLKCETDRKRLGVVVIRNKRGDETGEFEPSGKLLARQMIDYSKDGWVIDANDGNLAAVCYGRS